MAKHSLLVADDDRLVRVTLARGLREHGYDVIEAEDGAQAVQLGIEHAPDLAILDMKMPNVSGIEAAESLRDNADVPSVFLSAYDDEQIVRQAVEQGALGYLIKPVNVKQIVPTIESALVRADEIRALKRSKDGLTFALGQSREISVAVGIVADRHHMTSAQAFEALRTYARSQRRKLTEVSTELVESVDTLNRILGAIKPGDSKAK